MISIFLEEQRRVSEGRKGQLDGKKKGARGEWSGRGGMKEGQKTEGWAETKANLIRSIRLFDEAGGMLVPPIYIDRPRGSLLTSSADCVPDR